jgi:hypothetical protein
MAVPTTGKVVVAKASRHGGFQRSEDPS